MQFQVPQFIEVEDKIFGPLTFKQFIYLTGAGGLAFSAWRLLPFYFAVPIAAAVGGLGVALALFEWNGRPFILALENGFYYFFNTKLYIWSHGRKNKKAQEAQKENRGVADVYVPRLSDSRLHDLAWSLDIKERIEQVGMRDIPKGVAGHIALAPDELSGVRTAKEALVR